MIFRIIFLSWGLVIAASTSCFSEPTADSIKIINAWKRYFESMKSSSVEYSSEDTLKLPKYGNVSHTFKRDLNIYNTKDKSKILVTPASTETDSIALSYLFDGQKFLLLQTGGKLTFSHDPSKLNFQPVAFNPLIMPFVAALVGTEGGLNPNRLYDPYLWVEFAKKATVKTDANQYVLNIDGTWPLKNIKVNYEVRVDQDLLLPVEVKISGESDYSCDMVITYTKVGAAVIPSAIDDKEYNKNGDEINHISYKYAANTFAESAPADPNFWTLPIALAQRVYDADNDILLKGSGLSK